MFGVPSSAIRIPSISRCSPASRPMRASAISRVDVRDRLRDALAEPGVSPVPELNGFVLPRRRTRGNESNPERLRTRGPPRPRPSDCRASRAPGDRGRGRWFPCVARVDGRLGLGPGYRAESLELARLRARLFATSYHRSWASRSSSLQTSPFASASVSASSTRSRNRPLVARNASSGSTLTNRARLTTVNRRSPSSAATRASGSVSGAGRPARSISARSSLNSSVTFSTGPVKRGPVVPRRPRRAVAACVRGEAPGAPSAHRGRCPDALPARS